MKQNNDGTMIEQWWNNDETPVLAMNTKWDMAICSNGNFQGQTCQDVEYFNTFSKKINKVLVNFHLFETT